MAADSSFRTLFYGALGGAVARTMTAPFERIKVLQQVHPVLHSDVTSPGNAAWWKYFQHVARDGAWRELWKGNLVNVGRVAPVAAVRLYAYGVYQEAAERRFPGASKRRKLVRRLASAGGAGVTAAALTYPIDFVRLRWTVQGQLGARYRGVLDTVRSVLREEGALAFYKGALPSVLAVIPHTSINFTTYSTLRDLLADSSGDLAFLPSILCGGASGATALLLTFPFDVINKRLMLRGYDPSLPASASVIGTISSIYRLEGLPGYFHGFSVSFFKIIPSSAIHWSVIELLRRLNT